MNKRGQALPTTTIIILVLSLVVLVLLILYFTGGMKDLWGQIQDRAGIISGSESEARAFCDAWCSTENKEVCSHTFRFRSGDDTITKSCSELGASCPAIC